MTDELLNALDDCLQQLQAGANLETVLQRYPALAADLRPLLAAAQAATRDLAVPRPAQLASRARFLGRAAALRPARPGFRLLPRTLGTALTFVLGFAAGTYGVVAASAQSLPGDQLYGIKRAAEGAQLLIAATAERSQLEQHFATERVAEVEAVATQGRTAAVEFSGPLQQMEGARWQIAGLTVVVTEDTRLTGVPAVGDWLRVEGDTQPDGTVRAVSLRVLSPSATPRPPANQASSTPGPSATPRDEPTATERAAETGTETHRAGETPEPTERPEASETARPPEGESTSGKAETPKPEDTSQPESTDDHGGGGEGGGGSGPSPSNTPD